MTINWEVLNGILNSGSAEKLGELMDRGLEAEYMDDVGTPLAHRVVMQGKPEQLQLVMDRGARLSATSSLRGDTLCFSAITSDRYDMLGLLLAHDVDIEQPAGKQRTALHAAADHFRKRGNAGFPYIDRLALAGAKLDARDAENKTAYTLAKGGISDRTQDRIVAYTQLEEALEGKEAFSRETLFSPQNETRWSYAQLPGTWRHFETLSASLESRGEYFTRADLEQPAEKGMAANRPLVWLIVAGKLGEVNDHLKGHGEEPITMRDFVQEGKATPLLERVCEEWGVKALFESKWVNGLSKNQAQALRGALPPVHQKEIKNYHQLVANATRNDFTGRQV